MEQICYLCDSKVKESNLVGLKRIVFCSKCPPYEITTNRIDGIENGRKIAHRDEIIEQINKASSERRIMLLDSETLKFEGEE